MSAHASRSRAYRILARACALLNLGQFFMHQKGQKGVWGGLEIQISPYVRLVGWLSCVTERGVQQSPLCFVVFVMM